MIVRCPRCAQWLRYPHNLANPTLRCRVCEHSFEASQAVPVSDYELRAAGEAVEEQRGPTPAAHAPVRAAHAPVPRSPAPVHAVPNPAANPVPQRPWGNAAAAGMAASPQDCYHRPNDRRSPARHALVVTLIVVGGIVFLGLNIAGVSHVFGRKNVRVTVPTPPSVGFRVSRSGIEPRSGSMPVFSGSHDEIVDELSRSDVHHRLREALERKLNRSQANASGPASIGPPARIRVVLPQSEN